MLIGLVAGPIWVRVVFKAGSSTGQLVRAVDLSWEEVRELHEQLSLLLKQDPQRPSEQNRRGNLRSAEN